jgi:hypothetical protein
MKTTLYIGYLGCEDEFPSFSKKKKMAEKYAKK